MRLIDADALMKTLGITDMDCEKCAWGNKSFPTCNRGSDFADACSAIEDAPTIEERKNVRGEWKEVAERGLCDLRRCSNCGHIEPVGLEMITPKPNFCPNCGADMRGEEDDTDN